MRAAAARTFCTAGSRRPMRTAMIAITTSSSISVKPAWRLRDPLVMGSPSDWTPLRAGTRGSELIRARARSDSRFTGRLRPDRELRAGELLIRQQPDVARQGDDVALALGPVLLVGEDGPLPVRVEGGAVPDDVRLAVARRAQDGVEVARRPGLAEEALQLLLVARGAAELVLGNVVGLYDFPEVGRRRGFLL